MASDQIIAPGNVRQVQHRFHVQLRYLTNIRDLSAQTAAGASQTTAASQKVSRLAVDLNTMIANFVVQVLKPETKKPRRLFSYGAFSM